MKKNEALLSRYKWLAFWHWEYTCRNPSYRKRVDIIYRIMGVFDSIGELDNLIEFSKSLHGEVFADDTDFEIDDNWFTQRLEKHGEEYVKYYYKYLIIGGIFNRQFGRIFKDYDERVDSDEVLTRLINKEDVSFQSADPYDQYAVIQMRDD